MQDDSTGNPPPINPFKSLREQSGMSLGDLAQYAHVDIRAVQRSESGLYTNPLPALVDYWVRKGKISEGQLLSEYEDFVFGTRRNTHHVFGPLLKWNENSSIHPLRQLRANSNLGLIDLCRALCVPLDTVQFFEKKWRTQQTVPKSLLAALNQNGYTQAHLREFQEGYKKWRNAHNRTTFH